jgi:hypothetical protein
MFAQIAIGDGYDSERRGKAREIGDHDDAQGGIFSPGMVLV